MLRLLAAVRRSFAVAIFTVVAAPLAAQRPVESLETIVSRLDEYLDHYEAELGSLIADEEFLQETPPLPGNLSRPHQRRLESEVAFLRLPGNADWMGFRRVKQVDRKPLDDRHQSLAALLAITSDDTVAQAKLLVAQSSEHNLGNPRTINMPNLPLELVQRRHRNRFDVSIDGMDSVRRRYVVKLLFSERATPSLVFFGGQQDLLSRVRVWVDPRTGELHRAHVTFTSRAKLPNIPGLKVEFERHDALGMLVPTRMDEEFLLQPSGLGTGRATYSNFRRFQTSARIVPPPP